MLYFFFQFGSYSFDVFFPFINFFPFQFHHLIKNLLIPSNLFFILTCIPILLIALFFNPFVLLIFFQFHLSMFDLLEIEFRDFFESGASGLITQVASLKI